MMSKMNRTVMTMHATFLTFILVMVTVWALAGSAMAVPRGSSITYVL